jgi:hypothetical protein
MALEDALDLDRVDVDAVHDHHVVGAAVDDEVAVDVDRREVAGLEPPVAEVAGRRDVVADVAGRHAGGAHPDRTRFAGRGARPVGPQHLDRHAGRRRPDRLARVVHRGIGDRDERRLGRAVGDVQPRRRVLEDRAPHREGDARAADAHARGSRQRPVRARRLEQACAVQRRKLEPGDRVPRAQRGQRVGRAVGEDAGAALPERVQAHALAVVELDVRRAQHALAREVDVGFRLGRQVAL